MATARDRLLASVSRRQRFNAVAVWFSRWMLILGSTYAAVLLGSRLLSLTDWEFEPATVALVPLVALLLALAIHRRCDAKSAARVVDTRTGAKDLFLTSLLLGNAPGEYQPLVLRDAEARAAKVNAEKIAPLDWRDGVTRGLFVVLTLMFGSMFLPQYDPFGFNEERQVVEKKKDELKEQRKFNSERLKALKEQPLTEDLSKQVDLALEDLAETFNAVKPTEVKANLAMLTDQQKRLGSEWRKAGESNPLKKLEQSKSEQKFGQADPKQSKEWKEQMDSGDSSGLKQEMREAKELAKKLGEAKDPKEKEALKQKLEEKLRKLNEFANENAKNTQLQSALARAMQQLQAAGMQGLTADATEALEETMELSEMELDALAQAVRDMNSLEDALKAIQLAKMLNANQKLDPKKFQHMKQYMEYYLEACKECEGGACKNCNGMGKKNGKLCPHCKGSGLSNSGMGGAGTGQGNIAPEDDALKSDFKNEKSKSALTAGKMLLEWKQQELPESGQVQKNYADAVGKVKQGASEAILSEQVPPGYHEAIKKYFDTLEKK